MNSYIVSSTTTPRTTSIEEITPKTATCTEQLLALAAASHASADMAASSTQEVEDNQVEDSSSRQLLSVTSPIKIINGPQSTTATDNNEEKVPTPDKAVSSNSQIMSPTTATKITEAQTPKHCNKSPYNTSTTTTTTTATNNKSKEGKTTTANTISGPNPIGKQLNPNPPARSKPIKQYWPIRYSTINTNERRIQAELGNYSTSYVEGENERQRRIKERDASDAQRNYSQQQQRNIYEQQKQYVNAHRYDGYYNGSSPTHNYPHHPLASGTSSSTSYNHHQPMPQFVQKYSNSHEKYHYYEGPRYPPSHYEGYPPPHPVQAAAGGYYGSPSNYHHQYNVPGYSAAVAPHRAPPQATYGNTTGYQGSYQDKEVPLSTVPSTEDRSKDGSLHAVSSSFSNEGVVGSSKALMKSMQSPGVVTSNGSGSVGGKLYLLSFVVLHILCHFYTLSNFVQL